MLHSSGCACLEQRLLLSLFTDGFFRSFRGANSLLSSLDKARVSRCIAVGKRWDQDS